MLTFLSKQLIAVCLLVLGLASVAQANLVLLQATATPNAVTIPTTRASTVTLTFRSDLNIQVDGAKFCTAVQSASVPTCAPGDILQNASSTSGSTGKILRVRLFVPASVAARAEGGSVYLVQSLATSPALGSSFAATTRVAVRLDGGTYGSTAARIETGRLSVQRARVFWRDEGRRVFDEITADILARGQGTITAELRAEGIGTVSGWWTVQTPNGPERLMRFTTRASAGQSVYVSGPKLSALPQTLFGKHSIGLQFDPGTVVRGDPEVLVYQVQPSPRQGVAQAWVRDGRLFWRIQNAPSAYAVRIEGPAMRWPILSPTSGSGRVVPKGAKRMRVVNKDGVDVAPPVEITIN